MSGSGMKEQKTPERVRKSSNLTAILLCGAGVGLNMLLSILTTALDLPLYLDTVGTIIASILGGYLPGVIVGFTTNLLRSIIEPAAIYYGVMNVLVALVAAFFAERGLHQKPGGIVGMLAVFSLIGGVFGMLIPWLREGISFETESLAGILYETLHTGPELSYLLSALITNLPDKAISLLIALSLIRLIPARYRGLFRLHMWVEDPGFMEEACGEMKVRRVSLRIKTLLVAVVSLTAVALMSAILSVNVFRKMTITEHTRLAVGAAELAAGVVHGDMVDTYLKEQGHSEDYIETREMLGKILASSPEISRLYVYRPEPAGFRVIFDIDTQERAALKIGAMLPVETGFQTHYEELLSGGEIEPFFSDHGPGYLLTAAKPVYDERGRFVCYAIADVDMEKLARDSRSFLTEMVLVFLGFFLLLCTFTIWLTDQNLVIPINSLVRCMDRLARTSDSQKTMDEDVKMFRRLGIHTGDELENLYLSASSMTKNQAEQLRSIRHLSESTANMQDGLIITMADLVESRDSDTGAHVQKISAYVKIIVEGLKRKEYYGGKITPKFMSDVVRSAPLHDIGKINIPDSILNKPGKLTEEEFEIMKTHAAAGKQIIENAISKIKADDYLKEARNMAAYHHERWDGKGYPEGIHGEVIPLSARIMAVADVFDALTSDSVYKPAFPLEKALQIMEEGKGTQFDPKCLEAFLDSMPEVMVVLRKYNQGM